MMELTVDDEQVVMTMTFDEDKMCVRFEFLSSTPITGDELLGYLDEMVEKHLENPEQIYEEGICQQRIFN